MFAPVGERFTFARTAMSPMPDADPFAFAIEDRIGLVAVPPQSWRGVAPNGTI